MSKTILRNLCFSQKNERHAGLDQPEASKRWQNFYSRVNYSFKSLNHSFSKAAGLSQLPIKWRQSGSSRADRGTAPVRAPRPP